MNSRHRVDKEPGSHRRALLLSPSSIRRTGSLAIGARGASKAEVAPELALWRADLSIPLVFRVFLTLVLQGCYISATSCMVLFGFSSHRAAAV